MGAGLGLHTIKKIVYCGIFCGGLVYYSLHRSVPIGRRAGVFWGLAKVLAARLGLGKAMRLETER